MDVLKKRRKEGRVRARKRKGAQPRSAATTPEHKAPREGEAKFRNLVESTATPVGITDLAGEFTYVNKALADLVGYAVQELVGRPFMDFLHPEDREAVLNTFMKGVSTSEEASEIEFRVKRRDGQILTLTSKPTRLQIEGKTVGFQVIITDTTERKRVENVLRQQHSTLEGIINSSNTPIFSVDKQYRYTSFNSTHASVMKAIYGKDIEIGKSLLDYMTVAKDREEAKRNLDRALAGEHVVEEAHSGEETRSRLYFEVSHSPILAKDGAVTGVAVFARDITERKRAEIELRAAKERLDYVITSNPAVIFTAKPRADYSDYNIAYMSDRVVEMLGFEPRQFIGHPEFWDARVHPDDLRRYPMEVPELWKKGQHAFEYRFLHKDGTYRWIREEAKVIHDAAGKPVEVMGYWTDVTERKRMEAHLAEARRLAAIGETTAMVGHDLRNPLQAIVSTIYLAKRKLESPPEPSREAAVKPGLVDMLETIENESQYMNKIVSDLQDYATPLKTEPKPVQIESLVKDTLLKIRIPQNVKISFKVSEALQTVMIDSFILRRVFSNLIMNAIQAMPDGGELGIDMYGTGEFLFIAFKDTGVGIPEENMGKLFNPFFTTKAKGQGLGLPVCKKLVEAQNGWIAVESKPGEGSTFTVKLPLIKP